MNEKALIPTAEIALGLVTMGYMAFREYRDALDFLAENPDISWPDFFESRRKRIIPGPFFTYTAAQAAGYKLAWIRHEKATEARYHFTG